MENDGRVGGKGEFPRVGFTEAVARDALQALLQRGNEGEGLVYDVVVLNWGSSSTRSGVHWALPRINSQCPVLDQKRKFATEFYPPIATKMFKIQPF